MDWPHSLRFGQKFLQLLRALLPIRKASRNVRSRKISPVAVPAAAIAVFELLRGLSVVKDSDYAGMELSIEDSCERLRGMEVGLVALKNGAIEVMASVKHSLTELDGAFRDAKRVSGNKQLLACFQDLSASWAR